MTKTLDFLPKVEQEAEEFFTTTDQQVQKYQDNQTTLEFHEKVMYFYILTHDFINFQQFLRLIQIPSVLDTCIRSELYQEALSLIQFAQEIVEFYPTVDLIQILLQKEVSQLILVFQEHLLQKLRGKVTLPECLEFISVLRRLNVEALETQFLQSRDVFLSSSRNKIIQTHADPYERLIQLIDLERVVFFDIITHYEAIFSIEKEQQLLLSSWASQNIIKFINLLQQNVASIQEFASIATIIEQSMFYASSLGRLGFDCTSTLTVYFEQYMMTLMQQKWTEIVEEFQAALTMHSEGKSYATPLVIPSLQKQFNETTAEDPPKSLMSFPILAEALNMFLHSLNELRHCALISLHSKLSNLLKDTLQQLKQSLDSFEKCQDQVPQLQQALQQDFCPHLIRSFAAVYPQQPNLIDSC